jgi:FAD/FMN-containing dehydrogenase
MDSYLIDASGFKGRCEKVFAPASEAELLDILSNASAGKVPVTISGAGTGVTGGRVAQSGWVISMEKFQRVEIHQGHATVGAGVSLENLQTAAARTNQFYAPDPTENTASIGGNIATDASGSRSFRYGSTRKHILALRVVLMDGRVTDVRRGDKVDFDVPDIPHPNTTKNTAGYLLRPGMDWLDLFAGSEGTLGIVIEAELRLLPKPADVVAGVVFLPDDEAALNAVEQWRTVDGLRMIEYFDRNSLAFLRQRFSETPEHAGAALLIEQENGDIDFWADHAPEDSWFAASDQDRERFRRFRHALPELVNDTMRRRGFLKLNTDFAVPLARNGEMLNYYHARLRESDIDYVLFGHIGDAHLHVNVLPSSDAEFQLAQRLLLDFARHAVELGGTVSAEHGLGKRKAHLLELQYTHDQIESMKKVKRRLDPAWLLNQNNLFPMSPR